MWPYPFELEFRLMYDRDSSERTNFRLEFAATRGFGSGVGAGGVPTDFVPIPAALLSSLCELSSEARYCVGDDPRAAVLPPVAAIATITDTTIIRTHSRIETRSARPYEALGASDMKLVRMSATSASKAGVRTYNGMIVTHRTSNSLTLSGSSFEPNVNSKHGCIHSP